MANQTFGTTDPTTDGSQKINDAASSGSSAINAFDPNAWSSATMNGLGNLWNTQGTTQNNYFKAYTNAIANNPSVSDLYKTGNEMFNVPTLQANANLLNNTILQTPNSNLDAAKGFNYDQNQVNQKTSQDLQRLGPIAAAATANANTAEQNAGNYVTAGIAQNNFNLLPIQEQGQYLMDSYARQQSGFTTVAQAQLQALQDKMDQGVALSTSEMSAYASLTTAKTNYENTLANANAAIQEKQIGNQYQIVPAGQTLVNTFTGGTYKPA